MNDIFSWRRFRALTVKYYAENRKAGLRSVAGSLCFLLFLYWMCFRTFGDAPKAGKEMGTVWFTTGLVVQLFIGTARSLKAYVHKPTRIGSLTLPASVFEKYLLAWLGSMVFGFCSYLIVFAVVNYVLTLTPAFAPVWDTEALLSAVGGCVLMQMLFFFLYAACGKRMVAGLALVFAGLWFYLLLFLVIAVLIVPRDDVSLSAVLPWLIRSEIQTPDTLVSCEFRSETPVFFFKYLGGWLTWGVLAVGGYYKLKERQVK